MRAKSSAEYVDPAKNAAACFDKYFTQECQSAVLDEKIDGPPVAGGEKIAEQLQLGADTRSCVDGARERCGISFC